MGETKPKHGARNIIDYRPIDTAVIDKIKQRNPTINFDKTEGSIESLSRVCALFLFRHKLSSPGNRVRRSNKDAALKAMLHKGKGDGPLPALIKMLKDMDPHTESFLKIETKLADYSDPSLLGYFTIEDLIAKLEILNDAVFEGFGKSNERINSGGRPPDPVLRDFLKDLWPIYRKSTGRAGKRAYYWETGKGGGPFPEFVHSCIVALGLEDSYSLGAICSAIQKAFAPPKKNHL